MMDINTDGLEAEGEIARLKTQIWDSLVQKLPCRRSYEWLVFYKNRV